MSDITDKIYFNFPISLLSGFLVNKKRVLDNIFNYAIYAHTLKLEYNSETAKAKAALSYFGVTTGDIHNTMRNGEQLFDSIPDDNPKVGINKGMFFDYYKTHKSEFELVQLLAFLAIRSILKNKSYTCITNAFMLGRMDGSACSVKDYTELSPEIFKYANEYQTKKIKRALSDGWKLITYSKYMHGFYISFTLPLDELVLIAEKDRKKNKDFKAKKEVDEARKKALAIIYGQE